MLLPDQLALMESMEMAPDPFFGLMEPLLPSPVSIPHVSLLLLGTVPSHSSFSCPWPVHPGFLVPDQETGAVLFLRPSLAGPVHPGGTYPRKEPTWTTASISPPEEGR